jgi:hypothetical protein
LAKKGVLVIFRKKHKHSHNHNHKHEPKEARKEGWNNPWFYKQDQNTLYKIAIILDGEVQEVMTTETRLAALLLSNPIFVDISKREGHTHVGDPYDEESGEFLNDKKEEV